MGGVGAFLRWEVHFELMDGCQEDEYEEEYLDEGCEGCVLNNQRQVVIKM